MKKILLSLLLLPFFAIAQDGTLIDPTNSQTRSNSAALEVYSTNQGFLTPRIALTGTSDAGTVTGTEPTGLLIYNTATAGVLTPGFYYWNGSSWIRLLSGSTNLSGAGTLNYIAKWTPDGATLGNSQIFDNGINIGIATTTANNRLQFVSDNSAQGLQFNTSGYNAANTWGTRIYKSDIGGGIPLKFQTQSAATWYDGIDLDHGQDNAHPSLRSYYNTQLATSGGNVGVGNTAPGEKLDITGNTRTSGKFIGHLNVDDTRSVNTAPTGYNNEVAFDFKQISVLNSAPGSGTYGGLMTMSPWGDNSGDASHQLLFNEGGIYWRQGQPDAATWDAWSQVMTTTPGGSGLNGHVSYWTGPNTQGYDNTGNFFWDATNDRLGIGTIGPGWTLDVNGNTRIGANTGQNTLAALAVSAGQGAATTYRDIDLHGSWAGGEGHAISASHATGANNLVGQIVFEHNSPGSRIKFGRLYHSGDQTTYPMELVSNGSNAILRMNNDAYDYFGPNSTWGAYLQIGGNGRVTTGASVAATNGNLHMDAANGGFATYINYYSSNNTYINGNGANVGIGNTTASAKLHVSGGGQILGTNGTSSNTRTLTILEDGDAQTNFGSYPGAWTSALQIQSNDPARYIWLSPISTGGNARMVTIGSDFEILPGNVLSSTFYSSGDVTTARYHNAQYFNSSDNSVGSGVTGVMIKQGDNYFRTGTAAAVATFLNGTTTGPWIPNNGSGDWQIASSSTSTSYSVGSLELRESNFSGAGGTPPHLGMHWGGVVASNITIEGSGRIAIRDNPGTGYENFIARDVVSYSYSGYGNVGGTGSASWHPSGIYSAGYNWLYGGINGGGGSATNFGDVRANIFYDYQNTGYYVDPDGTSNMNQTTTDTRSRWGEPRTWTNRAAITGDQNYWTGTDGWGTNEGNWDNAWKYGFSGVDIWGTNTGHPQGAGYVHAQGIQSGLHYATSDGSSAYGWQMVGAADATANRYWLRGKWGGGTSGWVEMVTSGNYTSYGDNLGNHSATTTLNMNANTIATAGDILSTNNYGQGLVGVYSDVRYQNVWAMGTSWRLPADGTTPGNLYGLAWTHSNIGGQSKAGLSHQLLVMENGVTKVALGSGIWTSYNLQVGTYGGITSVPTSYGSIGLLNAKNGYYSVLMGNATSHANVMYDGGGNGGVYYENYGWATYYLAGNRHMMINTSSDLGATLGVNGNIVCTTIRSNGFIEPSDERLKNNIAPISGALDKVKQIQGVTYNWNKELERNKDLDEGTQYGVIAQELEKILPELITTDENDENCWKAVNYSHLVPILIEALKEQQATIDTQKQTISLNTRDIDFLKQYTKELEAKINTIVADKQSTGNK